MFIGLSRLLEHAEVRQHDRQLHLLQVDKLRNGIHLQLADVQLRRYSERLVAVIICFVHLTIRPPNTTIFTLLHVYL